jgi:hypothetical protein
MTEKLNRRQLIRVAAGTSLAAVAMPSALALSAAQNTTAAPQISGVDMSHECTVEDPEHYKLEFENEFVRVIRCRIPGRDKVKMHNHPVGSVIIFMTDQNLHQTLESGKTEEAHNKAAMCCGPTVRGRNTWERTLPTRCMNIFGSTSRQPCPNAHSVTLFSIVPPLPPRSYFWQHSSRL